MRAGSSAGAGADGAAGAVGAASGAGLVLAGSDAVARVSAAVELVKLSGRQVASLEETKQALWPQGGGNFT